MFFIFMELPPIFTSWKTPIREREPIKPYLMNGK